MASGFQLPARSRLPDWISSPWREEDWEQAASYLGSLSRLSRSRVPETQHSSRILGDWRSPSTTNRILCRQSVLQVRRRSSPSFELAGIQYPCPARPANWNWYPPGAQSLHCHATEIQLAHSSARSQHEYRSSRLLPLIHFCPDAEMARCHTSHISNGPSRHDLGRCPLFGHSRRIGTDYQR